MMAFWRMSSSSRCSPNLRPIAEAVSGPEERVNDSVVSEMCVEDPS